MSIQNRVFFFIARLILLVAGTVTYAAPIEVDIPASSPTSSGHLKAYLFRPADSTRVPVIVMMHGCNGAYSESGGLSPRHLMWGELLAKEGFAAVMLDSFTTRGLSELCTQKFKDRTLKEADRIVDAYNALDWAAAQPWAKRNSVGLLGWSHGASVTLRTLLKPRADKPDFRAAVAFYPGCTSLSRKSSAFRPYAPLLLLIGESDDWTPAAPCINLVEDAKKNGGKVDIVTYPGAYHTFDQPGDGPVRLRRDVANGVNPGQGAHSGPNPIAREDAIQRVTHFFKHHLQ